MSRPATSDRERDPAPLEQRPEAISVAIEELLRWVSQGRVRIPDFQRGFKWDKDDADKLFDSIYRGYPIGTLLFWKKRAEAAVIELGPLRINAPERQDALWVVDGQQRITTLAATLNSAFKSETDRHAAYFDLKAKRFVRSSKTQPPRPNWLPLNRIVDSEHLLDWLDENRDHIDRDERQSAIQLGKRMREYQIPGYVVETDSEEPLREIFDRSNSSGKALNAGEVFDALHGGGHTKPARLTDVADALQRETQFGRIDEDYLLRALLAVNNKDPGRDFKSQVRGNEAPKSLEITHQALLRSIVFLREQARIPHVALMPYQLPLVALARFFHLHPDPTPRSRDLLARWVWRGARNGRHQGNTVATRRALDMINDDEHQSVQRLLQDVGARPPAALSLDVYNSRYALSKLMLLALWQLGPRHLETGDAIAIEDVVTAQSMAQYVRAPNKDDPSDATGLANRVLHPPMPGGVRALIIAQESPDVLRSHAISPAAHAALRARDLPAFWTTRADDLRAHVESFLALRTSWDASDRPPIAALTIPDDDNIDGEL
ncbi:MAG: DUF262 domain-containing protein [Haliangiales bacterium]